MAASEPQKQTYYEFLGVPSNADESQIRRAYYKLALQLHPDKNPGDSSAHAKFQRLQQIYGTLSDKKKRADYDKFGEEFEDQEEDEDDMAADGVPEADVPLTFEDLVDLISKLDPDIVKDVCEQKAKEMQANAAYTPNPARLWTQEILKAEITKVATVRATIADFSRKSMKTLLPEIGMLNNLHTLYLSHNELSSLPAEFSQLNKLKILDLSTNKFQKFPVQIVSLPVEMIDLSHNQVEEIPESVGTMSCLKRLIMFGNCVKDVAECVAALPNLQEVDLECNNLRSLPSFPSHVKVTSDLEVAVPSKGSGAKAAPKKKSSATRLRKTKSTGRSPKPKKPRAK